MEELRRYTPIIYNPGSYGTYLNFVLSNLGNESPTEPFDKSTGSSHKFKSPAIVSGYENYELEIHDSSDFLNFHPKTLPHHSQKHEIDKLLTFVNKAIMIYPTNKSMLLALNNYYTKIQRNWLIPDDFGDVRAVDMDKIHKQWGVDTNVKVIDVEKWILREYLSMDMMPMWLDMHEWGFTETYSPNNLITITIDELLYEFDSTIDKITKFINIDSGDLGVLRNMHTKMISLQKHIDKDRICTCIINGFLNNTDFEFAESLSLIDEAWVQWELRNHGYEMYCNGMNAFPTNLHEFKEHTYKI